ncbi:hypothetical protein [Dongia sp.]|uniref:hypothetical protein n=1 Tax=Dongia sp. TaxID=1977262 RepID=UPI00375135FD
MGRKAGQAIRIGLVLALGIGFGGCTIFSERAAPAAATPKFPVPPGGLAKNNGAVDSSWGVFQPVAVNWSSNPAPAAVVPATYVAVDSGVETAPRIADSLPPAARTVAMSLPPAGTWQPSTPAQEEASFAAVPAPVVQAVAWTSPTSPAPAGPVFSSFVPAATAAAPATKPWSTPAPALAAVNRAVAPAVQPIKWTSPAHPVGAPPALAAPVAVAALPRSVLPQGQPPVVDYAMVSALSGYSARYPMPAPTMARQVAFAPLAVYSAQPGGVVTVNYAALPN